MTHQIITSKDKRTVFLIPQSVLKPVCSANSNTDRRGDIVPVVMENNSSISSVITSAVPNITIDPLSPVNMHIYFLLLTQNVILAKNIVFPLQILLGVFGNVMTIIIVCRFRAASSSSAMDPYFMVLAVTDLCVVITGLFLVWIPSAMGFYIEQTHDLVCKSLVFVSNAGAASSAWILVAMTTQRAVSVAWPHRVNVLCTRRRSWWTILTIVMFFSLAYSHMLYGVGIVPSKGHACTLVSRSYELFLRNIWLKIDTFLFSVLPFACLFLSNSVLVLKLRRSVKDACDGLTTTNTQQASRERNANSVTLTVTVVSLVFVVLTSPTAFYNFFTFVSRNANRTDVNNNNLAFRLFLSDVFYILVYFNYSVNFYLYCLTGERFRRKFREIMCGCVVQS